MTIHSTSKVVELEVNKPVPQAKIAARIWEGLTESGQPVHCYIIRVAHAKENPTDEESAEFLRDLHETRAPTAATDYIPLRMIL